MNQQVRKHPKLIQQVLNLLDPKHGLLDKVFTAWSQPSVVIISHLNPLLHVVPLHNIKFICHFNWSLLLLTVSLCSKFSFWMNYCWILINKRGGGQHPEGFFPIRSKDVPRKFKWEAIATLCNDISLVVWYLSKRELISTANTKDHKKGITIHWLSARTMFKVDRSEVHRNNDDALDPNHATFLDLADVIKSRYDLHAAKGEYCRPLIPDILSLCLKPYFNRKKGR